MHCIADLHSWSSCAALQFGQGYNGPRYDIAGGKHTGGAREYHQGWVISPNQNLSIDAEKRNSRPNEQKRYVCFTMYFNEWIFNWEGGFAYSPKKGWKTNCRNWKQQEKRKGRSLTRSAKRKSLFELDGATQPDGTRRGIISEKC